MNGKFDPQDGVEVHYTKIQSGANMVQVSPPKATRVVISSISCVIDGALNPTTPSATPNWPVGGAIIDLLSGTRIEVSETYPIVLHLIGLTT